MSTIANRSENKDPLGAGKINFMLGSAHSFLGKEGGTEEATLYYQKAIELAKKAGDNDFLTKGVICISECYLEMDRVDEVMGLHKSRCEEIGKESAPIAVLQFAEMLQANHETSRALAILEEHLEAIARSLEKREQCRAYGIIAGLYCKNTDFAKSNIYFERQLSIAKETKNMESEASALHRLGHNYGRMGDFGNAMAYLEQTLAIESEEDDTIAKTYCAIGDVLKAQEGREKEAILVFQNVLGCLSKSIYQTHLCGRVFFKLGQAYTKIEAWDDAITYLEKGLSMTDSIEDERFDNQCKTQGKQYLENTHLEKYESLPERNDEVIRKVLFWSEAAFNLQNSKEEENLDLFLDLAQEHYFLGDSEKAHAALKRYLEATMKLGPSYCQWCRQTCAKDAIMEKCSVCKVARYCSYAHSIKAWKTGRLCHKVMCPLLKRWRKITEGKDTTAEVDFFERVLASKPK